ncbi:unnamed protein product [Parnassius mnemosyne]|uniref:Metallothionein n=1 Tax=Parnassius mnemosyne TaxID=213953 RepID=A0AAV1LEX3_9NEOP
MEPKILLLLLLIGTALSMPCKPKCGSGGGQCGSQGCDKSCDHGCADGCDCGCKHGCDSGCKHGCEHGCKHSC